MPRRRTPALLAAATLGLALVSGCSGGPGGPASGEAASAAASPGSPSVSPTLPPPPASATPTPVPAPDKPRPPKRLKDDRAGRHAFAVYAVDAWVYAIATNDYGPLVSLSPRGSVCAGCKPLRKELASRDEDGWHVALSGVHLQTVEAPRKAPGGRSRVKVRIDIPESNTVTDEGTLIGISPAHPNAVFDLRLAYSHKGGYRLLSFSIHA